MSIASMTGFARSNGSLQTAEENINWMWEIKTVNGKSFDMKTKLPTGYEDLAMVIKNTAASYINRGSISAMLEINSETNAKKVKIDTDLLQKLTEEALTLSEKYSGKIAQPRASELMSLRGVIELEDTQLSESEKETLRDKILADFADLCSRLRQDRESEGKKIKVALEAILDKITTIVANIEQAADSLPEKIKEKLQEMLKQYTADVQINEDRMAQEIVFLVTRADIREEIDRLKAHIKTATQLLNSDEAVGRRLDFLCQELNREANTTCSKSADIAITDWGMELKSLIEQFREQVQNIE